MAYARNSVRQDEIALGQDIVRKSPKKARAYVHLGTAYMSRRMYSQAIDNFLKALDIAPDYSEAYYNLGASYYEKNDFDKAIFILIKLYR
jgi:tetratricopeptide (TPR) repeat protein